MEEMLSDKHEIVLNDPLKKLTNELFSLLVNWKNNSFIDFQIYRKIFFGDGILTF